MADQHSDTNRGSLSRRRLFSITGTGVVTVVLGRSAFGKDDNPEDHDDDEKHDDDGKVAPLGTVPPDSAEVRIVDDDADSFRPGTITIDMGGSVTWVNLDDDPHTATGQGFDTGRIDPGNQVTVTFEDPGSFPYACQFHPMMVGVVEVRDESGNVPSGATASPEASPGATPVGTPVSDLQADVSIANLAFDPAALEVTVGTTVVWTNNEATPHTVTSSDALFDSGMLMQGDSFRHVFDTIGTYNYACSFHPQMTGTVTVTG